MIQLIRINNNITSLMHLVIAINWLPHGKDSQSPSNSSSCSRRWQAIRMPSTKMVEPNYCWCHSNNSGNHSIRDEEPGCSISHWKVYGWKMCWKIKSRSYNSQKITISMNESCNTLTRAVICAHHLMHTVHTPPKMWTFFIKSKHLWMLMFTLGGVYTPGCATIFTLNTRERGREIYQWWNHDQWLCSLPNYQCPEQ